MVLVRFPMSTFLQTWGVKVVCGSPYNMIISLHTSDVYERNLFGAHQGLSSRASHKTVILATNQLQFVAMADVVVVMKDGAAAEVGSYSQLMAAGGLFTALMKEAQVTDMMLHDR